MQFKLVVHCISFCDIILQVIAATNRVDILDPALLRSGRLDRKIEFPAPNEDARARIMQIHSRKMNVRCGCITAFKCLRSERLRYIRILMRSFRHDVLLWNKSWTRLVFEGYN